MEVKIGGKDLANPVGVASGTFGYGSEYEKLIDLSKVGALYAKAVTLKPRAGNDIPRLVETPSGLLNSIGLANVGLERYITEKLPLFATLPCSVIANVAGEKIDEYRVIVQRLSGEPAIWGFEINLSCPNVECGLVFGTDPKNVEELTQTVRRETDKPLIIKLTPNVTDICEIARAAEGGGADGVSCINTLIGMQIDIDSKSTVIPSGTAGLSGPAILPVGIAAVYRVVRTVNIPVIGVGGIMEPEDAIQYLLAGASAVQIGTANFVDPATVERVLDGIEAYAQREELTTIEDFHHFVI